MTADISGAAPTGWLELQAALRRLCDDEPLLQGYVEATMAGCTSLAEALSAILSAKLAGSGLSRKALNDTMAQACRECPSIVAAAACDLAAIVDRDPSTADPAAAFLFHKGFHALQAHRMGHWLWTAGRRAAALLLQNRTSEVFAVDIHPAAHMGRGVFIDHATGVVIGETATVGDNVSILQDVTLGGTGKDAGDRHPKVGDGVLLCAGAKVLGNIRIGDGAKVGASSVVLDDVQPYTTVVGVPARVTNRSRRTSAATAME